MPERVGHRAIDARLRDVQPCGLKSLCGSGATGNLGEMLRMMQYAEFIGVGLELTLSLGRLVILDHVRHSPRPRREKHSPVLLHCASTHRACVPPQS
jgi:hypothetical protein